MSGRLKSNRNSRNSKQGRHVGPSRFYLWHGSALFLGMMEDASEHAHHALQVVVSIYGTFVLQTPGQTFESRSAVIAPDQLHRFRGGGDQAIILLDTESTVAQCIQSAMCKDVGVTEFDISPLHHSIEQLRAAIEKPMDCKGMKTLCQQMLSKIAKDSSKRLPPEPRIQRALDFMKGRPELKAPLGLVAETVGLSEGRLAHLFKEQLGIPIRRFLLWLRLVHAIENLSENVSLTTAAHNAGFADSAHFTRTFRRMFGVTPSALFKNSRFVQVIPCPD